MDLTGSSTGSSTGSLAGSSTGSVTKSEPYLWLHLAGIAAVPLCLVLCLAGWRASVGLPAWLVLLLVALVGIGPVVWMQWQRPFCIFSLVVLAVKPEQLSENQRRILAQFKAPLGKMITAVVVGLALVILWQLSQWAPGVRPVQFAGGSLGGLLVAMVSFLLANLFLQVPASVLLVLLTPDSKLMSPYPTAKISQDFTVIGLRVKQILPIATATGISVPAQPAEFVADQPIVEQRVNPVVESGGESGVELTEPDSAVAPDVLSSSVVEETVIEETVIEETITETPVTETPVTEVAKTSLPVASLEPSTSAKTQGSPLISIAIPDHPEQSIQNSQPEPTIIHSLTELIPSEVELMAAVEPVTALRPIPQASQTIVTVNAPAHDSVSGSELISSLSLEPAPEPAKPNVRNTVVRIL